MFIYFYDAKFARCFGVGTTCLGLDVIGAALGPLGVYEDSLSF